MKSILFSILSNDCIAKNVWQMRLQAEPGLAIRPGQFVEIAIPNQYLRRPISVCDYSDGVLTLIYKVVGVGTDAMSSWQKGMSVDVLVELGNGYDLSKASASPLLIGGGVGVPPLYMLAKQLLAKGVSVQVILGFNTVDEVFGEQMFRDLGCEVVVATADGSYGVKGFVTDAASALSSCTTPSHYYSCGPLPMLRAVVAKWGKQGQVSMEERMGCGFGACMGCSIATTEGTKRVCKDGPVFDAAVLEGTLF